MTGANLELKFRSKLPHLTLRVSAKEVSSGDVKKLRGYSLTGNIHRDFGVTERAERTQYIHQLGNYYSDTMKIAKSLPLDP